MKARHDTDILWSPNFWSCYDSLSASNRTALAVNLKDYFARVPITDLHFQDNLHTALRPQPEGRFTAEDTKHYYDLLTEIGAPRIRVNAELFVFKDGTHEILSISHQDYVQRMKDYAKLNLPLGACWEIRHWYPAHLDAAVCTAPQISPAAPPTKSEAK